MQEYTMHLCYPSYKGDILNSPIFHKDTHKKMTENGNKCQVLMFNLLQRWCREFCNYSTNEPPEREDCGD